MPRYGRPVRVRYDAPVLVSERGRTVLGRAANISVSGMLLFPSSALRVGASVWLRFSVLGDEAVVQAIVVRQASEQPAPACAVRFAAVSPAVTDAIGSLVARGTASSARARKPASNESADLLSLYQQALAQIEEEEHAAERGQRRRSSS